VVKPPELLLNRGVPCLSDTEKGRRLETITKRIQTGFHLF
jgi:hypothetical protein